MIESFIAALAPAAAALLAIRFCRDDLRRATWRWFVPVALLVFAPYWVTDRIPAPLDFLAAHVVPWMQPGVVVQNALQSDVVTQMLPWREIVTQFWRHREWPLINPYAGAGTALWANPQAAVLHPLTFLGLPFSTFAWATFVVVARAVIAMTGMFLFLREERRSEQAAVIGAIAYAFCGMHIAFLLFPAVNVTMMLPWLMTFIARRHTLGCAIATALLFLGGHPESVFLAGLLAIPYAIAVHRAGMMRYAFAAVSGALLAAPVVVPFLLAAGGSERAAHPLSFTPFEPSQLLSFVFPARFAYAPFSAPGANFNEFAIQYAGFATFALALFAIVRKGRELRFWIVMLLVLFAAAYLPVALMARARYAVAFVVSTLAAYGYDLKRDRSANLIAAGCLGVVLIAAVAFWPRAVEMHVEAFVVASAAIAIVSTAVLAWSPRLAAIAVAADLAVLLLLSIPPHSRPEFYPETGAIRFLRAQPGEFRVSGVGGSLFPNVSTMFGIRDIRVHDPMASEQYLRKLESGGLDRRGYFEVFHGFPSPRLANELGVRYFIAPPGVRSPLPAVCRGDDAVVFLNPGARDLPPSAIPKPPGWTIGWVLGFVGLLSLWLLRNNAALASR
ncbi:MAG TPA: hypothetical protein VGJ82_09665 [Thermoanaerobaculia bacterium]|jgi:hypothetical protein